MVVLPRPNTAPEPSLAASRVRDVDARATAPTTARPARSACRTCAASSDAHGRVGVARLGDEPPDRVVEVEQPVVAALQHQHGDQRLGDRPDPVLRVRRVGSGHVAGRPRPQQLAAEQHAADDRRQPPLRLERSRTACQRGSRAVMGSLAKASGGGQAQTRLRSPYAWSMRPTGGQYLSGSGPVGNTPTSRG